MQVQKVNKGGITHWVLLDDDMHLIRPVCEFLEFQRKIDRADNTLRAYATDLKIYWEFLAKGSYSYDKASVSVIADFVDYLRRGTREEEILYATSSRTNRSINRILGSVHRFYCYEQMSGICGNQTKKSIFKLKESARMARIVPPEQMRRFVGALSRPRDRMLFELLYQTGVRIQEALDLEISMLPKPEAGKTAGVFRQICSKGKRRDLYAPMSLICALNAFVSSAGGDDRDRRYLFVVEKANYAGQQLTYHAAYDIMRRTQEQLGMEFGFRDLRHTFCTTLIESGVDVSVVQQVMGQANLYTIKRYVHMSDNCLMKHMSDYWADRE